MEEILREMKALRDRASKILRAPVTLQFQLDGKNKVTLIMTCMDYHASKMITPEAINHSMINLGHYVVDQMANEIINNTKYRG